MDRTNTAQFADDFRSFLPLPAALDPPLEEALRHVLDNAGSLVRPRTIDLAATAYGMDAKDARELAFALKLVPALHGYVDTTIHPLVMLIVILLALLTGIAGALYPAVYAMRVRAVEALRFE